MLLCPGIISNIPKMSTGGFFSRADVYIKGIGAILAFVSLLLIIKSINFTRSSDISPLKIQLNKEIVITAILLILYTLTLPGYGFFVTTPILLFILNLMYALKEQKAQTQRKPDESTPAQIIKKHSLRSTIITALGYSAALTLVLYLIFVKLLHVIFP